MQKCISETMSASSAIPVYRSALLASVSAFFCVASGLTYYSNNQIAAIVGDRYPSAVEQAAFWTSLVIQPWIVIISWIESAFGIYILFSSVTSTLATSLVSASFLFLVLRVFLKRWSGWFFPALVSLCVVAGISICTFKTDTRIVAEANASYEGP